MYDENELFAAALGLNIPYQVKKVEFNLEEGVLHIHIHFPRGSEFPCPVCGNPCKVYDTKAHQWRHLNFFEHKTYLHAHVPRIDCPRCGVKTVKVPWSRPESGFTLLFEAFTLALCKRMPVKSVADTVGEHDTRIWRMVERYVEKSRSFVDMSDVNELGVDETSIKPGHNYVSVFADIRKKRVLFVVEGKDKRTFDEFSGELSNHNGDPSGIQTICMDMSPSFIEGALERFPNANITFDRFHVTKLANDAVDQIRRAEARMNDLLRNTRFIWLKRPENLTERQREKASMLQMLNFATARAYQMKLNLLELWEMPDLESASAHLESWYQWVASSDIGSSMKRLANTIKAHAARILNYFPDHLTSGLMEGINSLIQAAKARGYRNSRYLKTIIYLIAGKLDFGLPV
jgi:transposase